jgi:hypothetical protein
VLLALAGAARAGQSLDERVRKLEDENREILERLRESEARNTKLHDEVDRLRRDNAEALDREIDSYLESSAAGVEDWTPTKKDARWRLYGFIRFDVIYDTARASSMHVPTVVRAEDGVAASPNDDQFAFDARLTRIGFLFRFGEVSGATVTGTIETDFQNFPAGVPESRATPRIRLAYVDFETDTWRVRLGQDWDTISPLYPSANHQALMWYAGNVGDRRPQARFTWKGGGVFSWAVALGLTGAVDNRDLDAAAPPFTYTERDGFDSGHPHVQARGAWVLGADRKAVVGVWGFVGTLETDTAFGGERDFVSWVVGVDFAVPVGARLVVRGEAWYGAALSDMRGNIAQTINTATGDEIEGVGGWAEVQYLRDEWTFYVGGTIDDPDNADLAAGAATLNFTTYVGTRRKLGKFIQYAFDVIFWETQYENAGLGNMVRFNFWTSLNF